MKLAERPPKPAPKDWKVFCEKAGRVVNVEDAPWETTALALCSYCHISVHYPPHRIVKNG